MEIHEHAKDNYIKRVNGVDPGQANMAMRKRAEDAIRKTVLEPDTVHVSSGETKPIHMRGDVAVPVDEGEAGIEDATIPTTYHADTFRSKINDRQ